MNTANAVAKVFIDRDEEIFQKIVEKIDRRLSDEHWVLTSDNYYRDDEDNVTFIFKYSDLIDDMILDHERTWPTSSIKTRLCAYYCDKGFDTAFDHMNYFRISVDLREVEAEGVYGNGAGEAGVYGNGASEE